MFDYRAALKKIPHKPGVYQYWDSSNELIYIGKAKDLRNRVASYFIKDNQVNAKTRVLVSRIQHITFTIVDTEIDAWLLENSMIKKHQPRYNIMLKDDKTYPWIIIKNEPFPRIFWTRKIIRDGSKYLGPYASVSMMHAILDLIRETYPLRTCNLQLTRQNIDAGKFKVCLEYQLGNCKGPCQNYQTEDDYANSIEEIKDILNGKIGAVVKALKTDMDNAAANLDFELAHRLKRKFDLLENYQSKSTVVNSSITDVDVFSIVKEADVAFVNYLMVQNGTIIQTHTVELQARLEETESDILVFAIAQLRENFNSTAAEIVVPFAIDYPEEDTIITVPKGGDKLKLIELSQTNVQYFRQELRRQKTLHLEQSNEAQHKVLLELQQGLGLKELPAHIECFDNSNFQGSYPVSAMVCFKNGLPSKKDYRHFNVKTVTGINDFATMKEVVFRRYKRLVNEEQPLPQLVIIDGGKGQLSAAMESIHELNLEGKLTVVGLAKNEEEIFFPGDTESIKLSWNSEGLNLIRRIRDEVHRFGITFHRNKRSKGTFKNELENIEGIGEKTATLLLQQFKSVKKIKEASFDELQSAVGKSKAEIIKAYFN